MAKGNAAKELVIKKMMDAFGSDFIGVYDKKVYVWSEEDGEKLQIAISLTCPKIPVGTVDKPATLDFENPMIANAAPTVFEPAEFTDSERRTVEDLMKTLGL